MFIKYSSECFIKVLRKLEWQVNLESDLVYKILIKALSIMTTYKEKYHLKKTEPMKNKQRILYYHQGK